MIEKNLIRVEFTLTKWNSLLQLSLWSQLPADMPRADHNVENTIVDSPENRLKIKIKFF